MMKHLKLMGVIGCIVASSLSMSSCWLSDSNNPSVTSGSGRFVDPLTYFLIATWVVSPTNLYSVGLVNFQNPLNEPITFRLRLDMTNMGCFQFEGMDVTTIDNGDGTGTVEGDMPALGQFFVPLFTKESFTTSTQISMLPIDIFPMGAPDKGATIGTDMLSVTGYLTPFACLDYTLMTAFDIGGITLQDDMLGWTWGYTREPRFPSPPDLPALLAEDEIQLKLGSIAFGTQGGYGRGAAFPCGSIDGGEGLVVCPTFPATSSPGPFIHVSVALDGEVPLADPVNFYQYGLVFDADGIASNNFVASPDFPNDFFQGTDLWYFLSYDPTNGWTLSTVDASGTGNPVAFFSDARAIIRGNTIFWTIPIDEFPGAPTEFLFRLTAFRNNGPFNMLDLYQVDYEPDIDEPLLMIPAPVL